jgi:nucleotide-binding universal stress UspA family protein
MSTVQRILVPTDFSPTSDLAFAYALDLAPRIGAAIRLLHVIDDTSIATAYPDGFYVELPSVRAQLIEETKGRLESLKARCEAAGVGATTEVAVGRPAPAIAETAVNRGTDLIVMGTHGRSGVAHLVLGSVAERLVRTAPCPVLTVRDTARVSDALANTARMARAEN